MNNKITNKIFLKIFLFIYFFSIVGFSEIEHYCHGVKHHILINKISENCDCKDNACKVDQKKEKHCCKNVVKYIKIDDEQLKKIDKFSQHFTKECSITNYLLESSTKFNKSEHHFYYKSDNSIYLRISLLLI